MQIFSFCWLGIFLGFFFKLFFFLGLFDLIQSYFQLRSNLVLFNEPLISKSDNFAAFATTWLFTSWTFWDSCATCKTAFLMVLEGTLSTWKLDYNWHVNISVWNLSTLYQGWRNSCNLDLQPCQWEFPLSAKTIRHRYFNNKLSDIFSLNFSIT